jgi:peptidyl-prolyl cis-trans isomerase SurA
LPNSKEKLKTMIKKALYIIGLTLSTFSTSLTFGQKEAPVFTYGPHAVSYDEFKRGLLKNQNPGKESLTEAELKDYLKLYVHFKLKVQQAYDKKLDTSKSFQNELQMYRRQIARPFLSDKEVTEQLLKEAYDRSKLEVRASHILITVKNFDNVTDTLKARRHIDSVRNLIVNGKLDFSSAAEKFSDDPSAKMNKGDLGYFTAFEMVYPFESVAYQTEIGKVSPIFKTDYGYHIVQVHDRRVSAGEIKVAHLMIKLNMNAKAEEVEAAMKKANGIYEQIKKGEKSFEEMVKLHSEDPSSSQSGGELSWFKRTSQYPAEFKEAAFNLMQNGQISEPVKTAYGVHIIKRVDLRPIESFNNLRSSLTQKINRDSRSQQNTEAVFQRVSKELQLKENNKLYKTFAKKSLNPSLSKGTWTYSNAKQGAQVLFSFADQEVKLIEFVTYLLSVQSPVDNPDFRGLSAKHYNDFLRNKVLEFYEENLEKYNPEFKYLLQEYKDGILLFSLMDDVIWSRSLQDSLGLQAFYNQNKSKYQWADRFQTTVYVCTTEKIKNDIQRRIQLGHSDDSISNFYKTNDNLSVSVRKGKFAQGEEENTDALFKLPKAKETNGNFFTVTASEGVFYVIRANKFLAAGTKELEEVKGPLTSDFQDYLEAEWIKSLQAIYKVQINDNVVQSLISELVK